MTTRELFENAHLAALGMLDESERRAFDAAFDAAPEPVRAQIRREQARAAGLVGLLPNVSPRPELREEVIESVRYAILEAQAAGGDFGPYGPHGRARRVSPVWRGAALGFATAAVGLAAVTLHLFGRFDRLARDQRSDALVAEIVKTYPSRFLADSLFDPQTRRVTFSPAAPDVTGKASIFLNPDWASAQFFCLNLPADKGQTYRVVVVDDANQIVGEVSSFLSNGGLVAHEIAGDRLGETARAAPGGRARLGLATSLPDHPDEPRVIMTAEMDSGA